MYRKVFGRTYTKMLTDKMISDISFYVFLSSFLKILFASIFWDKIVLLS